MAEDRRIVVHHPDGRRVSVLEAEFGNPEHNPFNQSRQITSFDGNTGATVNYTFPARPADDHISLKDEGFVPVAEIVTEDVTDKDGNVVIPAGGERALDEALYRGEGLAEASEMSDLGEKMAADHRRTAMRLDREHGGRADR
jgi:hypothetical protein